MTGIKNDLKINNKCAIALVMFYENRKTNPKQLYKVLSSVLFSVIDNYV